MPKYKLTYFNVPGLGEGIRYLFHYANVEFEDNRISRMDWPILKKKVPFGVLPMLEVDGKILNQSTAICRFLGKRFGLTAEDPWTEALLDALVDNLKEYGEKSKHAFLTQSPELQLGLVENAKAFSEYLNKIIIDGKLYGSKTTWVDFYLAGYMESILRMQRDSLLLYPKIKQFYERIVNNENIVKYIRNKPKEDPIVPDSFFK